MSDTQAQTSDVGEILNGVRSHLSAGIELARQGLVVAERDKNTALEQFFHRCLHELGRACADARCLKDSAVSATNDSPTQGEQVSTAPLAPGDGATDADVMPEDARGRPGSWPAY